MSLACDKTKKNDKLARKAELRQLKNSRNNGKTDANKNKTTFSFLTSHLFANQ